MLNHLFVHLLLSVGAINHGGHTLEFVADGGVTGKVSLHRHDHVSRPWGDAD